MAPTEEEEEEEEECESSASIVYTTASYSLSLWWSPSLYALRVYGLEIAAAAAKVPFSVSSSSSSSNSITTNERRRRERQSDNSPSCFRYRIHELRRFFSSLRSPWPSPKSPARRRWTPGPPRNPMSSSGRTTSPAASSSMWSLARTSSYPSNTKRSNL